MAHYLINLVQPVGVVPAQEVLDKVMVELGAINEDIRAAGQWVFTGGLHQPGSSTVVRAKDDDVLVTDGPYAEGSEFVGGLWIVDAPDLDAALEWAGRISRATTLPTEVRPFQHVRP
jgi:hypothetical protein